MAFEIASVDVWTGEVEDRPEALPEKLEALHRAGANLDFAILRPSAQVTSSVGLLFVAPLSGQQQMQAARSVGLECSGGLHALRIRGPDRPGLLAEISRTLADAGIQITSLWATALDQRSMMYLRFQSGPDAKRAAELLRAKLGTR